ncbi:MAG: STAS domain-containing protein [Lentisphaeraceae bacterium]|nr:STAS domain-containing protein [Lentisphaeraceae bacterium]
MDIERNGNCLSLSLEKDLTAATVKELKDQILSSLDEDVIMVVVNLKNVEMIDSTGISLLISLQNTLKKNSGELSLENSSEDIAHMFKLMRLDKHFNVSTR